MENLDKNTNFSNLANRIQRMEKICEDQKTRIDELAKEVSACKKIQRIQFKQKREMGLERCRKGYYWINHRLYACCTTPNDQNPGSSISLDEVD